MLRRPIGTRRPSIPRLRRSPDIHARFPARLLIPIFKVIAAIREVDDPSLLLVCRLDAPTAQTVQRMITDSLATEKTGLWGRAYIDGAANSDPGLRIGDKWMGEILGNCTTSVCPVVYDEAPPIFPSGFPMTDCALYYGWYAAAVAGPFTRPDFHFVPGAVAVHIHSFSAATLRDPNANWVAPLLTKGAAASLGNVYEPYLQLTANLNVFNDRLLHGFTLAESAYMSLRALSWMQLIVGDPLYRPYAAWLQLDSKHESRSTATSWKTYHDFALKNLDKPAPEYRKLAREAASRANNCAMLEDLGLMEAHDGNWVKRQVISSKSRACYAKRDDILRGVLEEANAWVKQENPKRALDRHSRRVASYFRFARRRIVASAGARACSALQLRPVRHRRNGSVA